MQCKGLLGNTKLIPEDRIFFPYQTLMFDSFSCIPYDVNCSLLISSVLS